MTSVRRRHIARMSDDDASVREALLPQGGQDETEAPESPKIHRGQQQLIVYPGKFDLGQFLTYIISKWLSALGECWQAVEAASQWAFGLCTSRRDSWFATHPQQLSLVQEERLEQLWLAMQQPYQPDDPAHQQYLVDLWECAFPDVPCTALKSPQWKAMGWQGEDPTTDFRGAGLFGVHNLLYLARTYPHEFDRLMNKRTGQRSDWEYPFAAAGMNLTFMLSDLLGLKHGQPGKGPSRDNGRLPVPLETMRKQPVFTGFVELLAHEPNCFEELYCAAFSALDAHWLRQRASYMQFNAVLKDVLADVSRALKTRPGSLQRFQMAMKGLS